MLTILPSPVIALTVTPATPSVDAGDSVTFTAIAARRDDTQQDVAAEVVWASSLPAVATIAPTGVAQALDDGIATISARHADGPTATATLTVSVPLGPVTVTALTPARGTALGGTLLTIIGNNFTAGTTVTLGGNPATNVTKLSRTLLTARAPGGTPGSGVDVAVMNRSGGTTLTRAFEYVAPFALPGAVPIEVGGTASVPITLVEPAASVLTLAISSGNVGVASVPATVTVPSGERGVVLSITALAEGTAPLSVTTGGLTMMTAVFVSEPLRSSADLPALEILAPGTGIVTSSEPFSQTVGVDAAPMDPGTLAMASASSRTVTLTMRDPAPAGGLYVSLASSSPAVASVPPPVYASEGQRSVSFDVVALAAGATTITAVAGSDVFAFSVVVDQQVPVTGPFLSAPVGANASPTDGPFVTPAVGAWVR